MTYQAETLDAAQAEIKRLEARVRDLEGYEQEMGAALHRLPKPPHEMGDGPDERVNHTLDEVERMRRDAEDVRILLGIEDEEQIREAVQQVMDEREMLQSAYDEGQEEIERLRSNWTRDQAALALSREALRKIVGARNRAYCAAFAEDALSAPAMQRAAELDAARKAVLAKSPERSDTGECFCCGSKDHFPGCERAELERLEAADE